MTKLLPYNSDVVLDMAWYSLFVLKLLLNTNQPTNQPIVLHLPAGKWRCNKCQFSVKKQLGPDSL